MLSTIRRYSFGLQVLVIYAAIIAFAIWWGRPARAIQPAPTPQQQQYGSEQYVPEGQLVMIRVSSNTNGGN